MHAIGADKEVEPSKVALPKFEPPKTPEAYILKSEDEEEEKKPSVDANHELVEIKVDSDIDLSSIMPDGKDPGEIKVISLQDK